MNDKQKPESLDEMARERLREFYALGDEARDLSEPQLKERQSASAALMDEAATLLTQYDIKARRCKVSYRDEDDGPFWMVLVRGGSGVGLLLSLDRRGKFHGHRYQNNSDSLLDNFKVSLSWEPVEKTWIGPLIRGKYRAEDGSPSGRYEAIEVLIKAILETVAELESGPRRATPYPTS